MKLILCSVFLAHGAVVYTVCAPVSGGGCRVPNNLDICVISVASKGRKPGSHATSRPKKKSHQFDKSFQFSQATGGPGQTAYAIFRDDTTAQNGWQMSNDLSISTTRDITIHFTIDAQGQVNNITIVPFTSTTYQAVCNQLNQIHFIWRGAYPPPISTLFEKKICVR